MWGFPFMERWVMRGQKRPQQSPTRINSSKVYNMGLLFYYNFQIKTITLYFKTLNI